MYDVIIIGAGPSGMMAAIELSKTNKKIMLIDQNNQVGKKLLLTGNKRCNLTNDKDVKELATHIYNGNYLIDSLIKFGSKEIISYFNKEVPLKKESGDKIFPRSNKAEDITNLLIKNLKNNIVSLNTKVLSVSKRDFFEIQTDKGLLKSKNLIIATGGKSYPSTGSTGDGYKFAESLGHTINTLYPAETSLITQQKYDLMGISIQVALKYLDIIKQGEILFTHNGLSGPAILNISGYVSKKFKEEPYIYIDFLPNLTSQELLEDINIYSSKKEVQSWLREYLPSKISKLLLMDLYNIKIASISKISKAKIVNDIKNFKVEIKKIMPIESAIVTGGGIKFEDIDSNTLESLICKGLYFCGETLDYYGEIGGYNLTAAFSTGFSVADSIKKD